MPSVSSGTRLHLELPRAELGQRRDVTRGPEPESEVLPHHDPCRVQWPNHRVDKLRWAPARDLSGEVDDDDVVDAGIAEQLLAPLQGGEQQRHLIGPDHRHRVRPEGHRDESATGFGCLGSTQELDMSAMDSIEVADHDDGRLCSFDAPPGLVLAISNS